MAKLILSRKGFDSSAGGYPSPLMDHELISLAIPQVASPCTYAEVHSLGGINHAQIMADLKIKPELGCHLDPDLIWSTLKDRSPDWLPVFGQHGAALSHLEGEGVGEGDLFLFFGWFRRVEKVDGKWRYVPKAPDLHIIYGYLEVGEVVDLRTHIPPSWAENHPHVCLPEEYRRAGNTLFVAKHKSSYWPDALGGGHFSYDPSLVLTDPSTHPVRRSNWSLPLVFFDEDLHCRLSYHRHKSAHGTLQDYAGIKAAFRGQEFVMDLMAGHLPWLGQMKPVNSFEAGD